MLLLVLQNVQEQRSGVLHHVALHQEIDNGVGIDKRTSGILDQHSGESGGVGRVAVEDGDEEGHPVGGVALFLDESHKLVWERLVGERQVRSEKLGRFFWKESERVTYQIDTTRRRA